MENLILKILIMLKIIGSNMKDLFLMIVKMGKGNCICLMGRFFRDVLGKIWFGEMVY